MTRTLADLRAAKPTSRPERSLTLCLAPNLVAEVMALTEEMATLVAVSERDDEGNLSGPPKRVGQGDPPRVGEIRARLAELLAEMAEHEGELRVRATSDGDWRLWANAHPPRSEGEPGYVRDMEVSSGRVNADDLIADLGTYAYSWNGEVIDGDWPLLADNIAGPDLKMIAQAVVAMHESRLDFRQWRTALSANLSRFDTSASPANSGSAPGASSAGSRGRTSAATTKRATK